MTLRPGRVAIDYEVSLAELTLAQDLRRLSGAADGADREALFRRYGQVTAPLNARGLLVAANGELPALKDEGFDLAIEDHPRYTFHFSAHLAQQGRLTVQDTNYAESQGTSRLAVRGLDGVTIRGDDLPGSVEEIEVRPTWMLSEAEQRRTRQVEVEFRSPEGVVAIPPTPVEPPKRPAARPAGLTLTRLLDRAAGPSLALAWLIALGLGAAHAAQPGHGKTLVAIAAMDGGKWRGAALGLIITLVHTGSVLGIAGALWVARTTEYGAINLGLQRSAGFILAAIGCWRLGRHLGGHAEHDAEEPPTGARGLLGLGVAGGIVPCWDAIALIVLTDAAGRLGLGVLLLSAFSLGMAAVLVVVGRLVAGVRASAWLDRWPGGTAAVGVLAALVLVGTGLFALYGGASAA